jgi:hypothetical protein
MTNVLPPAPGPPSVAWPITVWSEARQVTGLLGWPVTQGDDDSPHRFFEALRATGRNVEAAQFLGLSLPRYEAIVWAARALTGHPSPTPDDRRAMDAISEWLRTPSDGARRAAWSAAEPIDEATPAKLCATAVFLSGGSIAPTDEAPIPAPRHSTGALAAGAVLAAAFAAEDPAAQLSAALDLGAAIAAQATEHTA